MKIEMRIGVPREPISSPRQRQRAIAALATAQHGLVARRQLLAMGFGPEAVKSMKRAGWLHVVHRGVYAVGHRVVSADTARMAAVLACGPGALLSHRSGAALWCIRRSGLSYVEVTVPTRRGSVDGIRPYVCRRLEPQDRAVVDGIPCTSVALTLLNLAAVVPRRALERACDEAEVQRLFNLAAIDDVLDRFRGCREAAGLRAVLDEHAIGTTLTRPGLEEAALRMIDCHALPRPEVNVRVACGSGEAPEVDFLWRRQRLVLETDGGRFHSSRSQIERDRRKESLLVQAGYRVLRATWWQGQDDPRGLPPMA